MQQCVLGHAWLNLWDKHVTTGRINQNTIKHYSIRLIQTNPPRTYMYRTLNRTLNETSFNILAIYQAHSQVNEAWTNILSTTRILATTHIHINAINQHILFYRLKPVIPCAHIKRTLIHCLSSVHFIITKFTQHVQLIPARSCALHEYIKIL